MRPVLVGINGRDSGWDALALGRELARRLGAPLICGAVCGYETGGRMIGGFVWPLESDAERWLADAVERLGDPGVRTDFMLSTSVPHGLVAMAERMEAQMLVVGASRHAHVLGGSTVHAVTHGAPCAVAIAPRGRGSLDGAVGAAVTDKPESRAALELAARLAAAAHAPLRVLTAVHVATPVTIAAAGASYGEWREGRRGYAARVAHEAVAAVAPDSGAETVVLEGDPVARIGEASRELGLLVVGSRHYGPLRSVLLGSVSTGLLDRAACPLIVVPRGAEVPGAAAQAA